MSLQNHTLIVLFMDRLYLHQDSRDQKSSLIICPAQFNLSLLSWVPSAFYFPYILASVLIFLNAARLLCHFQPGDLKYNLKNLSPPLVSNLWGIQLKLDLEISQVCFYFYQTTRLFKNIDTYLQFPINKYSMTGLPSVCQNTAKKQEGFEF